MSFTRIGEDCERKFLAAHHHHRSQRHVHCTAKPIGNTINSSLIELNESIGLPPPVSGSFDASSIKQAPRRMSENAHLSGPSVVQVAVYEGRRRVLRLSGGGGLNVRGQQLQQRRDGKERVYTKMSESGVT